MITRWNKALRRFSKEENGGIFVIEFVILLPVIFAVFLMSVEMSLFSLRQIHLTRGMEQTVRYIRLHTNEVMTHNQIKDMVCTNSGNVGDCSLTLRLEMVMVNPRTFATLNKEIDCVDQSLPIEPERGFSLGKQHELMLLRACVKFDPLFKTSNFGFKFETDGSGQASLFAISAFVQEPS